jgi:hypothetical protein
VLLTLVQPVFNVLIISPCWNGVKYFVQIVSFIVQAGCTICAMDEELIRQARSELARQGGLARAKALTAKQRRESALKASKAAAKARVKKAKARRAEKS